VAFCPNDPATTGQYLITLDSSVVRLSGALAFGSFWSHESRRVISGSYGYLPDGTLSATELELRSAAGALLSSVSDPGYAGFFGGFTGDDVLFTSRGSSASDPAVCVEVDRVAANLGAAPVRTQSVSCDNLVAPLRRFPNITMTRAALGTSGAAGASPGRGLWLRSPGSANRPVSPASLSLVN
jgi:hypothetical protein